MDFREFDKIKIDNLTVFANHGVFHEENVLGQKFVIRAVLYTHTRKAGKTDDLESSIHYGVVSQMITAHLQKHTYKLLERCAEALAEELLTTVPHLEGITLEIQKPWAPVGLPLDTVSVEITRGYHTAYIGIGSNLGDKKGYLDMAVKAIDEIKGCNVEKVSSYIVTEPYGGVEQDDFLNGAVKVRTFLDPHELLEELHGIEQKAKRERIIHWGPRTLDLDILLYDDAIIDTEELLIPHIEMHKREFVLVPMTEIAPYKRHPIFQKTMSQLLDDVKKG